MKKKILSLTLAIAFCTLLCTHQAFAVNAYPAPSDNARISVLSQISQQDLFVPTESALYVAEFFIRDMKNSEITVWDDNTSILNTVAMYDETGENITAYSIELTQGYIVVSAAIDVPNPIVEWSDTSAPLYDVFSLETDEKVMYLGSLSYYMDSGMSYVEDISGATILRSQLEDTFTASRNASNISDPMLELIYSEKVNDSLTQRSSGIGSPVSDPFQHASTWYGGTYTCNDYQNKWEDYIECTLISSYSGYAEHCGPTAITNMLIMYGNRYNKSTITSKTSNQIFSTVATIGTSNSYYTNSSTGGTTNSTANAYIRDSFNNYSVTSTVNGQYNMNYTNIEISLRNNRLAYLMTTNHSYYLNHHIVCYAYTRLVNNSGTYATYIKVIDGWASSPRYIDISSLSSNKYWEVQF